MKKPKKPKPPKPLEPQLQPALPALQPAHLLPDQPTLVKRISEHPIMLLAGMLAALAAVGGLVADALRQPDISADQIVDPSRPFSFPFNIKNESWIFDMSKTELFCGIDEIRFRNRWIIKRFILKDSTRATIEPGEIGLFRCSIDTQGAVAIQTESDMEEGHIRISVGYRTLWVFPRHSSDTEFTWFTGAAPHWAKGKVAK